MARSPIKQPTKGQAGGRTVGIAIIVLLIVGVFALTLLRNANRQAADGQATDEIAIGKRVYAQQCASCHGINLEGQPNWQAELPGGGRLAPPHDLTGHTWHHPDQQLFDITKYGGQKFSAPDYKNYMPAYAERMSDAEIWAVLAYIKSTWPPNIREAQAKLNP